MTTFNPAWVPSVTSRGRKIPRVLKAQFGDGYEQRSQDGINACMQVWNLVFDTLTFAELTAIDNFLTAAGGWQKFTWVTPPPFSASKTFVCENWAWTYDHGIIVGLTAEFLERPPL